MSPIEHVIVFLNFSKYLVLFFLCIVEGPVVMVTSGFLLRVGQFRIAPLYFSLMAGDFAADLGWYAVGRYGGLPIVKRFGKFLNITPEIILKIEKRFKAYQDKILFISKITMGFGFALATLIVAGILKVDFKRYAVLNLLGGFIWTALLLTVGFFFGDVYVKIIGPLKVVFAGAALVIVIAGMWAINRYLVKMEI